MIGVVVDRSVVRETMGLEVIARSLRSLLLNRRVWRVSLNSAILLQNEDMQPYPEFLHSAMTLRNMPAAFYEQFRLDTLQDPCGHHWAYKSLMGEYNCSVHIKEPKCNREHAAPLQIWVSKFGDAQSGVLSPLGLVVAGVLSCCASPLSTAMILSVDDTT